MSTSKLEQMLDKQTEIECQSIFEVDVSKHDANSFFNITLQYTVITSFLS